MTNLLENHNVVNVVLAWDRIIIIIIDLIQTIDTAVNGNNSCCCKTHQTWARQHFNVNYKLIINKIRLASGF